MFLSDEVELTGLWMTSGSKHAKINFSNLTVTDCPAQRGIMSNSATMHFAEEWKQAMALHSPEVREFVKQLIRREKKQLAGYFYKVMLADEAARLFLSHETVQNRLLFSLEGWLEQLFSLSIENDFKKVVERQRHVGEVHARIDLPVHLVLKGARQLKIKCLSKINASYVDIELKKQAFELVSDSLDIAMEVMSQAYAVSFDRKSRAEESYRLFSAVHNAAAEKARQHSALLDWENQLMYDLTLETDIEHIVLLSKSDFGLWFMHKGLHAFDGLPEAEVIQSSINKVDGLIKKLSIEDRIILVLKEIRVETRNIQMNVESLFDKYNELEAGRDELTKLLSRKYLSVVLAKEVSYARNRNMTFALLAIDLDFFKKINDTYGHESGDLVLQQFSELLISRSRAGDYVFRLGGEEFLLLIVDVNKDSALLVANQLSNKISEEKFVTSLGKRIKLTASIGVTLFDGHPDYSRSLKRADKALYEAKANGRNQVVYLEPEHVG